MRAARIALGAWIIAASVAVASSGYAAPLTKEQSTRIVREGKREARLHRQALQRYLEGKTLRGYVVQKHGDVLTIRRKGANADDGPAGHLGQQGQYVFSSRAQRQESGKAAPTKLTYTEMNPSLSSVRGAERRISEFREAPSGAAKASARTTIRAYDATGARVETSVEDFSAHAITKVIYKPGAQPVVHRALLSALNVGGLSLGAGTVLRIEGRGAQRQVYEMNAGAVQPLAITARQLATALAQQRAVQAQK